MTSPTYREKGLHTPWVIVRDERDKVTLKAVKPSEIEGREQTITRKEFNERFQEAK